MKAVLYGTFPARECERLSRSLTTDWTLVPLLDEDPVERKTLELADADVLVASKYGIGDPPAPRIRLLQCSSAGIDRLDLSRAPAGCVVCNVFEHEIAIAEYVICAVLTWALEWRRLTSTFQDGKWTLPQWVDGPMHGEAFGKTIGIVGFGRIGREVARRGKALGMRVTALSAWRSSKPDPALVDQAFTTDEWQRFLAGVDYLAVCAPLSDETEGMVDARWFAAMRPNAVVINVGRGAVIDEESLYAALQERRIRGATLDVWYGYPKPGGSAVLPSRRPFHELPNVVMTPHSSGRSEETWERRFRAIARNLDALARGEPLENVIQPARPETAV